MDAFCLPTITRGKCHLENALISLNLFGLHKKKKAKKQRVADSESICITDKYSRKAKFEAEKGTECDCGQRGF